MPRITMKFSSLGKRFKNDRRGAIEGLPLYMIILVIITVVSIGIILSWLLWDTTSLDRIEIIEPPSGEVKTELPTNLNVTIKAFDENNKGLSKVTLKFEGSGLSESHKTGSDGKWTGTLTNVDFPPNSDTGEIRITASFDAFMGRQTKTATIIINRGP